MNGAVLTTTSSRVRHPRRALVLDVSVAAFMAIAGVHNVGACPDGHGIEGMRERAAVYGGTVESAPCSAGGWRVLAHFPYPEGAARS